jgi:A/G-specific adenine glycosylase
MSVQDHPQTLPLDITRHTDRETFRNTILGYYHRYGRDLPWRNTEDPYHIFVSEFMLQQTQVQRVLKKYGPFIEEFGDFHSLHRASLKRVLSYWSGLGYNRRCLYMKRCADIISVNHAGILPDSPDILAKLPGIGRATASALVVFSHNRPAVFIETNIRRVFLYFFFHEGDRVTDSNLFPLIERTLDKNSPRIWYYALMDYGSMLKKQRRNPNLRSTAYRKQPPFEGSNRQVRGRVLKLLVAEPGLSTQEIISRTAIPKNRILGSLSELEKEGFVLQEKDRFRIAD